MRRAVTAAALIAMLAAGSAAAADLTEDAPPIPAATGSADQVVIVNGRESAMISLVMGSPSVPGFAAKSTRYIAPDASLPLKLAPGSTCDQTVIAKFADGATVHTAVSVCGGPVVIGG